MGLLEVNEVFLEKNETMDEHNSVECVSVDVSHSNTFNFYCSVSSARNF